MCCVPISNTLKQFPCSLLCGKCGDNPKKNHCELKMFICSRNTEVKNRHRLGTHATNINIKAIIYILKHTNRYYCHISCIRYDVYMYINKLGPHLPPLPKSHLCPRRRAKQHYSISVMFLHIAELCPPNCNGPAWIWPTSCFKALL